MKIEEETKKKTSRHTPHKYVSSFIYFTFVIKSSRHLCLPPSSSSFPPQRPHSLLPPSLSITTDMRSEILILSLNPFPSAPSLPPSLTPFLLLPDRAQATEGGREVAVVMALVPAGRRCAIRAWRHFLASCVTAPVWRKACI